MKKRIAGCIILLLLLMGTPATVLATATGSIDSGSNPAAEQPKLSENADYSNYAYLLDRYDIAVIVNENNTFDITEKIGAYFNSPKHGIYRTIPMKNRVTRLDGTVSTNRVILSNIIVDASVDTSVSGGYTVIKIGDADTLLTGPQNYTISYNYNIGKDTGKDYDEFYFNLIGSEWDTAIGNVSFKITMPKPFDAGKLGFSRGQAGSTDSSGIAYQVDGNVISGSYDGTLNAGEGLTVRLELPEGYFKGASDNFDFLMLVSLVLPILFVLFSLLMWVRFGRDRRIIETVEFYPPEGFNSAEIGFLYKGKAENKDVVSLLIYLANKGYLRITETAEHALFIKSKAFKLTKLKNYDDDNANERLFLTDLFRVPKRLTVSTLAGIFKSMKSPEKQEVYDRIDEVTSSDLANSFYMTVAKIIKSLNRRENMEKIFEKSSLSKGILIIAMIVFIYLLITFRPVVSYGGAASLPFALIFPGIGFTVLFGMVFGKTPIPLKLFGLVWGLGFGGVPWALMVLPALLADPIYLITYIVGLACVLIMVMLLKVMPKRTSYGSEVLGKIRGFKTFLETAEKPKLEALVLQDPTYFYNILPYTYVLGVSEKWIEKFESLAVSAPDWYDSQTPFSMLAFGTFMHATLETASTAMASSPGGSGGSSGGGSSGGGSGGGGGGSW